MVIRRVSYRQAIRPACFVLLLLFPFSAGAAQDEPTPAAPEPLLLDPDSAAALAVDNSIQLQVDAQSVAEAEARVRQALALDEVTLTLSGSVVRRGPTPDLPPGFESFFINTIHTETLAANKILWSWGRLKAQRELARRGLETARTASEVTRLALAKLAREALLGLAYDERLLDVDYETVASLMEHQRVSEKRYREGLIAFFEVAQAEAQVAGIQSLIADRQSTIARDRVLLRRILSVDQTTPVEVRVNNMPKQPDMTLKEAIEYALEMRPETVQARTAVRLQEAAIRVAQTSLRPTVAVSTQVQEQTAVFGQSPVTYGVVLSFEKPILDGGARKAQVTEARARAEAARLQLELLAESIAAEVADQYVRIEHLKERIAASDLEARAAREQLRIARLRFGEDVGLGVEVIDAQAAVSRAETNRATAELDLHLAIVGLRAAMGMLDLQEAPEE